jgi:hypothetical protein
MRKNFCRVLLERLAIAAFCCCISAVIADPPDAPVISDHIPSGHQSNTKLAVGDELLDDDEDELLDDEDELLDDEDELLDDEDELLDEDEDELLDDEDELLDEDEDELLDDEDELLDEDEDELLDDEDELLDEDEDDEPPAQTGQKTGGALKDLVSAAQAHADLFAENRYPSANTCKVCHAQHYKEWSVSQHAYAQLSPVYMAMQNTINSLTSSTNGDFCIRCHNQVGMNMGESPFISNLERHPTSREGITCVVCHRQNLEYGKVSGRVAVEEGDLLQPVYGPEGGAELKRLLDSKAINVVTQANQSGRKIHATAHQFAFLESSAFCGSCHDVNLYNGFRLEEAFSEYKHSPAAAEGTSCQDCHMGNVQGIASGYPFGSAAVVGGVKSKPRKLTNHFFAGPDYSVVHPGIFPHNADAAQLATLEEWLQFDHKAGWGTDAFEDAADREMEYPAPWRTIDSRYDAREIIEKQLELLAWAREKRLEVLRNGYVLDDIETTATGRRGLQFKVGIKNPSNGHNVPTGFIAERLVWLEVTVTDPAGKTVFQSGDLDPNGDVRDSHSLYVHAGKLPLDGQLVSLQSKFLTRNVRGGEREQVLAVNHSLSPLPFVRPSTSSTILTGQPTGARTHRKGIPPLSTRWSRYRVRRADLTGAGTYTISVRLKAAMVPVNLVDAIKEVGFDFGMTPREVAEGVVAGHEVLWEKTTTVKVDM